MIWTATHQDFLKWLAEHGHVDSDSAHRFLKVHNAGRVSLPDILAELSELNDARVAALIADYLKIGLLLDLSGIEKDDVELSIDLSWQEENQTLLTRYGDRLRAITADPFPSFANRALNFHFDGRVDLVVSSRKAIAEFFGKLGRGAASTPSEEGDDLAGDEEFQRLKELSNSAPNIKLVNDILHEAVTSNASDIHIEPAQNVVAVRVRHDGQLSLLRTIEKGKQQGLVTRLKVLANLNLAERRLPQDGRCRVTIRGDAVDFRVATMPSTFGETIVLRILNKQARNLTLESLGFQGSTIASIENLISRPNGLILVAGPTGSGKTTTLYAILSKLNRGSSKIFTIEDPIEYRLEGLTQTQIDPQIGLTFASALRSVLRHDPDIILLGEIRDPETATVAVQASLTGHLVLATIHTNSAVAAITRLRDMGIPPYLVSASLRGVISQRLAKTIRSDPNSSTRIAVAEILHLNDDLKRLVNDGAAEHELLLEAKSAGYRTLAEHISSGVADGILDAGSLALMAGDD